MAANDSGAGDMETAEVPLDFEEDLATASSNTPDSKFDSIIGHIEDIIMEDEFQQTQNDFMEKYYREFEDTEENKLIYTQIHQEYIDLVERYLFVQLSERVEDFSMEEFQRELVRRKHELLGEVFEILLTFSDFMAFKEMFIDYKNDKEGGPIDFSADFVVHSLTSSAAAVTQQQAPPTLHQQHQRTLAQHEPSASSHLLSQSLHASVGNNPASEAAVAAQVHSLHISGQNVLISTPSAGHNQSNHIDLDFAPNPLQINRAGSGGGGRGASLGVNGVKCAGNGVSLNGKNGDFRQDGTTTEAMNVSPRTDSMDH